LNNKVDVLHVQLTELHAAQQNLLPVIRTLRLKETIQNIHQKRPKSEFFNRSNLFITYFRSLMGLSCVTVQLKRSSHYSDQFFKKVTKWHLLWMQHTKTCLSRPQGQYWAGRTFPPNNPPAQYGRR